MFQGRGIGQHIVRTLQGLAAQRGMPLELRVFPTNPRAQRFYERLGFREVSRTSTGVEMQWCAA